MTNDFTEDAFLNGAIRVRQSRDGYRFSIDAVILARHLAPAGPARIVDLGTGCGIIPLLLAGRYPEVTITGVEIQPQLSRLAEENVRRNDLAGRVTIACQDLRSFAAAAPAGRADLVTANPPFREASSGRINPNRERALARHEIAVTINDVTAAAARLLRVAGEFAVVYPASRLIDLVAAMRTAGLEPKQLRLAHSRPEEAAKLAIIRGRKNGRPGLNVQPPLFIYQPDGTYTEEAARMFQP
ncbi:MAG: tRNA1(Val) (adenine(37)-N6)-methyltransferase [Desulfosudaceae bacterium]